MGTARGTRQPGIPAMLDRVLAHSDEALVLTDAAGWLVWASPAATRLLDGSDRPLDAVHPDDRVPVADGLRQVAHSGGLSELRCRVSDGCGGWRGGLLVVADHLDDPAVGAVVTLVRTGGVDAAGAAALEHRADHDALTGLPNRSSVLRRLEGPGRATVLFTDLDGFKAVNDSLGHAAGDRLLTVVAERLRRAVRPGDTVGRLGGDEFVVLAVDVANETVALEVAERIRSALNRPIPLAGRLVRLSVSVGIALGDRPGDELLRDADTAMYRAKQAGGDRCEVFHDGMAGMAAARLEAERVLREALDGGGLAVAYEPVVELETGARQAMAAHLELHDSSGSPGPGRFIDLADRSGLMVSVGAGLLDSACAEAGRHLPATESMWIPVTSRQLHDPRFAGLVDATLTYHRLAPGRLVVSIEEAVLPASSETAWRNLADLRAMGVRLGLVGYGGGGAPLAQLRRAAPHVVCLDPALVAGLDEASTEVVRAYLGLGSALGATTVAVGVERSDQAERLRLLGCRLACGPLFGATRSG
jgi:diguanylate cyclase (GGDEF)-like protein